MKRKKCTKRALIRSVISLILCFSMLLGTTFAWFTDSVTSINNIIQSGILKVGLEYYDADSDAWKTVDATTNVFDENALWEPGYTDVVYLRVSNNGNLALKYDLGVNVASETGSVNKDGKPFALSSYIKHGAINDVTPDDLKTLTRKEIREKVTSSAPLSSIVNTVYNGEIAPDQNPEFDHVALVVYMPEEVGNEANHDPDRKAPEIKLGIQLVATQLTNESDSFGPDYDEEAVMPDFTFPTDNTSESTTSAVATDDDGKVSSPVTLQGTNASADVPTGVQMTANTEEVTLTVTAKSTTDSNLTLDDNTDLKALDVHMEGVAENNTVPMQITLKGAAPIGLNSGNLKLYHVEDGATNQMEQVDASEEFTKHNQFKYDPATGDIVLNMQSFSEVAMVADTTNPWNGTYDTSWYNTTNTELVIANADQLAGFGLIVGGMASNIDQDSFADKTVKLISNINIGDLDSENGIVFYPIGYYNDYEAFDGHTRVPNVDVTSGYKEFKGTFDGNGHTIANFYQNTWEMFGDYNDGYSGKPNYNRDGMGLFGKVYGGTVKNLTVENFSSDGEFSTTGVIAAYADSDVDKSAVFENIAIVNCNPRVYNIGNGGIVGCGGWYSRETKTSNPITFKNITVDNTNKITALWGSWDVACAGLMGQYYPNSGCGVSMENCHVAAQIDVYNDVCANYQYYAYRYAGMLIGSVRENETIDGHEYPKMDGIIAENCTVHFGDWNDYYYCELVANSLASYTHDHQMSRLEQVQSVDTSAKKIVTLKGQEEAIPTSGAANYVVVKAKGDDGKWIHGDGHDFAECYHFVNGEVWTHDMAGYEDSIDENGDGAVDLKEDKQLVYREFNQLVTGYGWGVTSKGVGEMDGVTILDREEGNSVVKFVVQDDISETYRANNERAIGQLFKAANIVDPKLSIKGDNVQVTVSPKAGTDSTAGCVYTPNTDDWTKGKLMFTGKGEAVITITDYYFCTATTVEVEIVENRVTGLSIKTNKNIYDISKSETFAASDITVTAVYSDGIARTLDESEYSYNFKEGTDSDFTTFGQKTGVVSYTYAEDTVTAEFAVFAVNMGELTLAGVPEVEGEQRIQRYFEQFGINAVGQKFYTMPGVGEADLNKYGTSATLEFATGTVDYTVNSHAGLANYDDTDKNGQLTINCTSAPFADIFGYVGYADRVPIAFGVYVDTIDNLTYTLPMEANADITKLTGTENSRIFYIQAPLNTMNLSAGEHKVHFVSIFDDGVQPLTTWTVNVAEKEEVDISQKTANVVILAGQSNAYGASALTEAVKGQAASADYSNIFINYSNINCENGVWKALYYNSGFESYHPGVGGTVNGACFGPEVGIAHQLATNEATKDEVWYIIKYTAAGSVLDGQWLEGTYDNEGLVSDMGGHLSDLMLDYVDDSLAKITAIHGDNIRVHSFAWMQGESDALAPDCAGKYQANEKALVDKVRTKYAQYAKDGKGENIIFVNGAIAEYADIDVTLTGEKISNGWVCSDTVNKGKMANAQIEWSPSEGKLDNNTSNTLINSAYIGTSDLLVGANAGENNDPYHYSSSSMWILGDRFGTAIWYTAGLMNGNSQ